MDVFGRFKSLGRLAGWALGPPHSDDKARTRRTWLVAGLSLVGGPVTGVFLLVLWSIGTPFKAAPAAASISAFFLAYVLARGGRALPAAWLLLVAGLLGPGMGMLLNRAPTLGFQGYALFLPCFLAAVLISGKAAAVMTVLGFAVLVSAWRLGGGAPEEVVGPGLFGFSAGLVSVLAGMIVGRDMAELQKQRDDAVRYAAARTAFLARAGHELKTPLSAVLGYTELALQTLRKEEHPAALDVERVQSSGRFLLGLVEEVLELSRLELGRMPLQPVELDAQRAAEEAFDLVAGVASGADTELDVRVDGVVGRIVTDRTKLVQILVNLLTNAIKASPGGKVVLTVRGDPRQVDFVVEDDGCGLSEEDQAHLFEEFWQPKGRDPRQRGVGLGLAITRQLSRLLGASIEVKSALQQGSTFTLRLPREREPSGKLAPQPGLR